MTQLTWTHAIADMPSSTRNYTREATPEERAAVAADLGLMACARLHAAYTIRAIGGGRYKLTGACKGDVTQACVVTLEPIENAVDFKLDVEFSPAVAKPDPDLGSQDEFEVSSIPEIEPIDNGQLEVGRVIFEAFAAAIDPYPKKPDAAFTWEDPSAKDSKVHPFAVLAKLKPQS